MTKGKLPLDSEPMSESKHDITMTTQQNIRRGSKQAFDWDEAKRLLDEVAEKQQQSEPAALRDDQEEDLQYDNDFEPEDSSSESPYKYGNLSLLEGEKILDTVPRYSDTEPSQLPENGSWKMETIRTPEQSGRSKIFFS